MRNHLIPTLAVLVTSFSAHASEDPVIDGIGALHCSDLLEMYPSLAWAIGSGEKSHHDSQDYVERKVIELALAEWAYGYRTAWTTSNPHDDVSEPSGSSGNLARKIISTCATINEDRIAIAEDRYVYEAVRIVFGIEDRDDDPSAGS